MDRETLNKRTSGRVTALAPRSPLTYLVDMSRVLTAGRLVLRSAITLIHSILGGVRLSYE